MPDLAPIAIFAYRRVRHLTETLASLQACPEFSASPVYVFSDAARRREDEAEVASVRQMLRSIRHVNITVVEAEKNLGLAKSIISGVSRLCDEYGRVIVIEDDLIVHPTTLYWFNSALDRYEDVDSLVQIAAYQFRAPEFRSRDTGVLLSFANSWGWATWKRAWRLFDPDATGWQALNSDAALRHEFDEAGSYPMADMLVAQMEGELDSWAIRWRWSTFRAGGLTLFPPRSLVRNIGMDATGTHNTVGVFKSLLSGPPPYVWTGQTAPLLPAGTHANPVDQQAFRRALRRTGAMRNASVKAGLRRLGLWRRSVRREVT